MKTGKMKQSIYIIGLITLFGLNANAQIATSIAAASVVNKSIATAELNLKASLNNSTGEISWKALKKIKVKRYQLEKSADGENFSYVTSVAGTNNNYSFTDGNILDNMNYYRIKIVDADDNYVYSSIASLDTKSGLNEIKVLPTQINQKLFIWVPSNTSISKAIISDASGRTVIGSATINNTTNLSAIETANLPVGLYNIKLQTNKGETVKLKFNKQS